MPKVPSRSTVASRRHNPLADDILSAGRLRTQSSKRDKRKSREAEDEEQADREQFIEAKLSRKILQIGQELADEDSIKLETSKEKEGEREGQNPAFDFRSRFEDTQSLSDDEDNVAVDDDDDDDDQWGDEEVEHVVSDRSSLGMGKVFGLTGFQEIDPNDLDTFHKFVPGGEEDPIFHPRDPGAGQGTNLADLILEKIAEHEARQAGNEMPGDGGMPEDAVEIPAKAVEVYEK